MLQRILLYLQTFYPQILMYSMIHLCVLYVGFFDVQYRPEDDQDRSQHVGVMEHCV